MSGLVVVAGVIVSVGIIGVSRVVTWMRRARRGDTWANDTSMTTPYMAEISEVSANGGSWGDASSGPADDQS